MYSHTDVGTVGPAPTDAYVSSFNGTHGDIVLRGDPEEDICTIVKDGSTFNIKLDVFSKEAVNQGIQKVRDDIPSDLKITGIASGVATGIAAAAAAGAITASNSYTDGIAEGIETEIAGHEARLDSLQSDVGGLNTDIGELDDRVAELEESDFIQRDELTATGAISLNVEGDELQITLNTTDFFTQDNSGELGVDKGKFNIMVYESFNVNDGDGIEINQSGTYSEITFNVKTDTNGGLTFNNKNLTINPDTTTLKLENNELMLNLANVQGDGIGLDTANGLQFSVQVQDGGALYFTNGAMAVGIDDDTIGINLQNQLYLKKAVDLDAQAPIVIDNQDETKPVIKLNYTTDFQLDDSEQLTLNPEVFQQKVFDSFTTLQGNGIIIEQDGSEEDKIKISVSTNETSSALGFKNSGDLVVQVDGETIDINEENKLYLKNNVQASYKYPLSFDDEKKELSLLYGNGLTVNTENELVPHIQTGASSLIKINEDGEIEVIPQFESIGTVNTADVRNLE
jgi:hypothetical protein